MHVVRLPGAPQRVRSGKQLSLIQLWALAESPLTRQETMADSRLFSGVQQAVRRLRRARAFTAAAVLTLALGIGATTAIFSLVNTVLLRPLPWPASEQLVDLSHTLQVSGVSAVDQSDAGHLFYRRENKVFTDVGAYRTTAVNIGGVSGGAVGDETHAARVSAAQISAAVPGILRVPPMRGRSFTEDEDHPSAASVALISERLWKRKYNGDPSLVGKRIDIDGMLREIVGIMPDELRFPAATTDVWLPIGIDPLNTESATFGLRGIARLRDGINADAATIELTALLKRLPESFPGRLTVQAIEFTKMRAVVRPLRDVIVGDIGRTLWVVLGAVAFVLLVACANVANLFLVRAEGRQRELAVRRALGAGRGTIAAGLLTEGVLLAAVGGVLGVALAWAGVRFLRSLEAGLPIPRLAEVGIDGVVLAVAAATTLLVAFLVSLVPAFRSGAQSITAVLGDSGRTASAGPIRHRARNILAVSQVALALVLLSGAGLMARSFSRLRAVEPGFDAAQALSFRVALPEGRFPDAAAESRFIVSALDAVRALPGVTAAGVVSKLPLDPEARRDTALFVEEITMTPGQFPNVHRVSYASANYFDALGIPLLEGRAFAATDPSVVPLEVIVSRALADRYWPGQPAEGKQVRLAPLGPTFTIVGVAGNVRGVSLDQPPDETIYLPLVTAPGNAVEGGVGPARFTPREIAFVVRTSGQPSQLVLPVERALRALDGSVPLYRLRPMTEVVSQAAARTSFTLVLLSIASVVALVLGAVGIYGVISYVVSLRTPELAVRLALGAGPADLQWMVLGQAAVIALVGVAAGLVGAMAVTRVLSALLFGVAPNDLPTLLSSSAALLVVALAASWLPARRASVVDPAGVLRAE
jgi:predicted permease